MPASTLADSSQVRPSRGRLLRRALLALFLLLWTAFVAVSAYQWINYAPRGDQPVAVRVGLSLFFLSGPLWVLGRRLRGLRHPLPPSFTASAALTASVAVFLAWLAQDDETWLHAERHPALRSDFPEAAATYALTLRYSKRAPGTLAATVPRTKLGFPSTDPGRKNDENWVAFLGQNRVELDRLWTESAALRAWIGELAAAPALGDLGEYFSPAPSYPSLRLAGQISCARALQLAAEGRRDEAVETMLPVLGAAQKLEPHSRTMMRRMIAVFLRRLAQNTLGRVLDTGDLSPAMSARLAQALAPSPDVAEQARLLTICDLQIISRDLIELNPSGIAGAWFGLVLRPLGPLLYNPVRTANIPGDYLDALGEAAARRDLKAVTELGDTKFTGPAISLPGKNYLGRSIMATSSPSNTKAVENFWKAEDERAALLARLQAPRD